MLAHSFLIESSSKLLVTRTGIKARTSSISGLWFPWPIYMFFEMRFDLGTFDSDAIVALWATCLSIPQVGKGYVRLDLSALVKIEKTLVWYARNNFLCNRTSLLNVWFLLCYGRIRSYATLIAYELHIQQYSLGYGVFEC